MCEKGCRATRDMDTRVSTPLLKHFKERIACGDLRKEGKMGERQRKGKEGKGGGGGELETHREVICSCDDTLCVKSACTLKGSW